MSLIKIKEYLNSQGKTIEKPSDITKKSSDQKPPEKPEKNLVKGKKYSFPAASDKEPNPYMAKTIKVGQKPDDETGLGDLGTPKVDFEDTKKDVNAVSELSEHCGCENKKAPFVVAYTSGAYHPDPIQAIKYIVYLTNENENLLKALMHEAKKIGCLKKYTDYLARYPELYESVKNKKIKPKPKSVGDKLYDKGIADFETEETT